MNLFYLLYYGYENTVIESQVVTPLEKLRADGLTATLISFEKPSRWLFRRAELAEKRSHLSDLGLSITFLPRVPRNFLGLNTLLLFLRLLPALFSTKPTLVHARGLQGAACASGLKTVFKKLRVICDVRGFEAEEYEFETKNQKGRELNAAERLWKTKLEAIELKALERSDTVFFVSRAMMSVFQERVPLLNFSRFEYVPCAVNTQMFSAATRNRDAIRKKNFLEKRMVVVYSGASQRWQGVERLPSLFKRIKQIEPAAFFLGITPDKAAFTRRFEQAGIPPTDVLFVSANYKDVPDLLACGDMGILLREESPVNAYACPTKFSEYLASGLHVITTPAVYDIADVLRQQPDIGTVIDNFDDEKTLDYKLTSAVSVAHRTEDRITACVRAAKAQFDWDLYVPVLKKWYLHLLQ